MEQTTIEPLLTAREAAALLKTTRAALYRYARANPRLVVRFGGSIRFPQSILRPEALLAEDREPRSREYDEHEREADARHSAGQRKSGRKGSCGRWRVGKGLPCRCGQHADPSHPKRRKRS